jgi:hypothetical protein
VSGFLVVYGFFVLSGILWTGVCLFSKRALSVSGQGDMLGAFSISFFVFGLPYFSWSLGNLVRLYT